MTRPTKILPVPALAAALVLAAAGGRAQAPPAHSGHAPATASAVEKAAPLGDAVKAAVEEAFLDELRGEAIYARVLKDHGDVRPFSNVIRAERRHAAFLEDVLKARGLAVPAPPAGDVPAYPTVREACAAAVAFEAQNVALYDRLLAAAGTAASGPLPGDVKQAFEHNRMASLDHHKPAFERCAGVAAGGGMARGAGRGHGARAGSDESRACGHGQGSGASHGSGAGHGCGHGCGHGNCGGHGCSHGHRGGHGQGRS
jgi:hypothetical protein